MQARMNCLPNYVPLDNKHIKFTITLFQRISSSNPRTFQTVFRHNCSQLSSVYLFIKVYPNSQENA